MGQSIVNNTSHARLVDIDQANHRLETDDRPVQEIIAQRVSQRARRRLFVAMLPLIFATAILAYVLAHYGI